MLSASRLLNGQAGPPDALRYGRQSGAGPATSFVGIGARHDKIRGSRGAYEAALAGIRATRACSSGRCGH